MKKVVTKQNTGGWLMRHKGWLGALLVGTLLVGQTKWSGGGVSTVPKPIPPDVHESVVAGTCGVDVCVAADSKGVAFAKLMYVENAVPGEQPSYPPKYYLTKTFTTTQDGSASTSQVQFYLHHIFGWLYSKDFGSSTTWSWTMVDVAKGNRTNRFDSWVSQTGDNAYTYTESGSVNYGPEPDPLPGPPFLPPGDYSVDNSCTVTRSNGVWSAECPLGGGEPSGTMPWLFPPVGSSVSKTGTLAEWRKGGSYGEPYWFLGNYYRSGSLFDHRLSTTALTVEYSTGDLLADVQAEVKRRRKGEEGAPLDQYPNISGGNVAFAALDHDEVHLVGADLKLDATINGSSQNPDAKYQMTTTKSIRRYYFIETGATDIPSEIADLVDKGEAISDEDMAGVPYVPSMGGRVGKWYVKGETKEEIKQISGSGNDEDVTKDDKGNTVAGGYIPVPDVGAPNYLTIVETVVTMDSVPDGGGGCQGCGNNSNLAVAGGLSIANNCVELAFNLGRGLDRGPAGSLYVRQEKPTALLFKPESLQLLATKYAVVSTTNGAGAITTVQSANAYAEIIATNALGYRIDFYSVIDGEPQTEEDPFVSYRVENSSGVLTNINNIRIIENRGAMHITNEFAWSAASRAFALVEGNGLRKTVKKNTYSADQKYRYETKEIRNADDSLAFKRVRKYETNPNGEFLLSETDGEGLSARTSYYQYDSQRRVTQEIDKDGSWNIYQYDDQGRVYRVYSAFQDQAPTTDSSLCRRTDYSYTPIAGTDDDGGLAPGTPRQITRYLLGHEIGRSYAIVTRYEDRDIQCPDPGMAWNNTNNLVTVMKRYDAGQYQDYVKSVDSPDGTLTLYTYQTNEAFQEIRAVYTGTPDTGRTNVVDGTKTATTKGAANELQQVVQVDIASGLTISSETYTNFDGQLRPQKVTHIDGSYDLYNYTCCNVESEQDRHGVVTSYTYDALKRQTSLTQFMISQIRIYDAAGKAIRAIRQGTNGTQMILSQATYDTAGRLICQYDAYTNLTKHAYATNAEGGWIHTTTGADTGVRREIYFREGALKQVDGSAVFGQRFEYGTVSDESVWRATSKKFKLLENGQDSQEWVLSYNDGLGRGYKVANADSSYERSYYNVKGQRWKQREADGVVTLFQYNAKGEAEYLVVDMNRDDIVDFEGADRVSRNIRDVISFSGANSIRNRIFVWNSDGADSGLLISEAIQSVDGLRTWGTRFGVTNSLWQVCDVTNSLCWVTNRSATGVFTVTKTMGSRLLETIQYDTNGTQVSSKNYVYDAHGRQAEIVDAHSGATSYVYDSADRIQSISFPPANAAGSRQTTTNLYDTIGRTWKMIMPDNSSVTNEFYLTGLLKRTYGSRKHPVRYTYDYSGRIKTVTTWQDFLGDRGLATTMWSYDAIRGFMISKKDEDDKEIGYTYTAAGRLSTRTWSRGVVTVYGYNNAGDLVTTDYSDSTPHIGYTYNRLGQQGGITNGLGGLRRSYNEAGLLLSEIYTNGVLSGILLTNAYDTLLRRTDMTLKTNSTSIYDAGYTYDSASRLMIVSDGSNSVTYSYVTNSDLVAEAAFKQNGTNRMTTTKQYDGLDRLTNITSTTAAFTSSSVYLYNDANQRIRFTREDGSYWQYEYNGLGQAISGKKYWDGGNEVKGMQYEYRYDDIGNRQNMVKNSRESSYSANTLNQYKERTVPGMIDVLGTARTNAVVVVNGRVAQRKSGYFWNAVPFENRSTPVWAQLETLAIFRAGLTNDLVTTNKGSLFLAKTPELFTYDVDGNLLTDGQWTYTWDGENRLVQMETKAGVVAVGTPKRKLEFAYDHLGRRLQKKVSDWNGANYVLAYVNHFVYDEWNVVAIFDQSAPVQLCLLGKDVAGLEHTAGGIGGVVALKDAITGSTCFTIYDGNGNVMALANSVDGSKNAEYEYGPFGEEIRRVGALAQVNPFRFSTKYEDKETDLLYYGYRYYSSSIGRWINRDPSGERNGLNLFEFCNNSPINFFDSTGLKPLSCEEKKDKALKSRGVEYWLKKIEALGCSAPTTYTSCCFGDGGIPDDFGDGKKGKKRPALGGTYSPTTKETKICCGQSELEMASTLAHEMVHAYDDCRGKFGKGCEGIWCSEVRAYYSVNCSRAASQDDRIECAISSARESVTRAAPMCALHIPLSDVLAAARDCLNDM